jgi:hypothetical protein
MTPAQLQREMIDASRKAYSLRRLLHALIHSKGVFKALALGETVWHAHLRRGWKKLIPALEAYSLAEPERIDEEAAEALMEAQMEAQMEAPTEASVLSYLVLKPA